MLNGGRRRSKRESWETDSRHSGHAAGEIGVEVLALLQRQASRRLCPTRQIGEQIIESVSPRVDYKRQIRRRGAKVRGSGGFLVGEWRRDSVGQLRGSPVVIALIVGPVLHLFEVAQRSTRMFHWR